MFLAGQLTELRVDVVHAWDRDAVLQAAAQRLSCDALDMAADKKVPQLLHVPLSVARSQEAQS